MSKSELILVSDESLLGKSGKRTYGLDIFLVIFNIKEQRIHNFIKIHNFINLSVFIINLSQSLIIDYRKNNKYFSLTDLISFYRSKFYTYHILKLIKKKVS
ncbi:MAG: hypothetical protein KatS3mg068_2438 [Candidatus Sericytochromatia bacterium]|nr:MAG: hypothetical protein KatS3mg068_2438 [Candidatus Sericytochromatia bacterium]